MRSWLLRMGFKWDFKQDILIISVKINLQNYPKGSFLSGITMTLHTQGTGPGTQESIAVSPGEVFLVRISKVIYEKLNSSNLDKYDTKVSSMGDLNFSDVWGNKEDTVVLAFKYDDLNVMVVRELPPYTILTFLSETGGVLGLLIGTNLVNLIVFLFQWMWGLKGNETNWFGVKKTETCEDNEEVGLI